MQSDWLRRPPYWKLLCSTMLIFYTKEGSLPLNCNKYISFCKNSLLRKNKMLQIIKAMSPTSYK